MLLVDVLYDIKNNELEWKQRPSACLSIPPFFCDPVSMNKPFL